MKTKFLAGGQGLCRPEVLKAHVDTMSFGDKKIKACAGLNDLFGLVQWPLEPGESP